MLTDAIEKLERIQADKVVKNEETRKKYKKVFSLEKEILIARENERLENLQQLEYDADPSL